jgi:hypothetical protein
VRKGYSLTMLVVRASRESAVSELELISSLISYDWLQKPVAICRKFSSLIKFSVKVIFVIPSPLNCVIMRLTTCNTSFYLKLMGDPKISDLMALFSRPKLTKF